MAFFHDSKKIAFLVVGSLSLILGIIGLLLPVVPQVPFLLLAFYCFVRGSNRLHRLLQTHPRLEWLRRIWEQHHPSTPEKARKLARFLTVGFFAYAALGVAIFYVYRYWMHR